MYYSLTVYYLFLRVGLSLPGIALNVPRLIRFVTCKSPHSGCFSFPSSTGVIKLTMCHPLPSFFHRPFQSEVALRPFSFFVFISFINLHYWDY